MRYTAQQGTSDYTAHLGYLDGPDIADDVTSTDKAAIETIAAAMNFATNHEKLVKQGELFAEMLEQIKEFK